jgi:hypothetical protein
VSQARQVGPRKNACAVASSRRVDKTAQRDDGGSDVNSGRNQHSKQGSKNLTHEMPFSGTEPPRLRGFYETNAAIKRPPLCPYGCCGYLGAAIRLDSLPTTLTWLRGVPSRGFFTTNPFNWSAGETISAPPTWCHVNLHATAQMEPMTGTANEIGEEIDRPTSRSICRAIGERLRQNLRPENSELPSDLRTLMDELRRQDARNSTPLRDSLRTRADSCR